MYNATYAVLWDILREDNNRGHWLSIISILVVTNNRDGKLKKKKPCLSLHEMHGIDGDRQLWI